MFSKQTIVTALIALAVSSVTGAASSLAFPYGALTAIGIAGITIIVLIRIWPHEARPDWTIDDVVRCTLGSTDLQSIAVEDGQKLNAVMDLFSALVQEAALGRLTIFGSLPTIPGFMMKHVKSHVTEIPSGYWIQHEINLEKFFEDHEGVTAVTHYDPGEGSYYKLRFDSRQTRRFAKKWISGVTSH